MNDKHRSYVDCIAMRLAHEGLVVCIGKGRQGWVAEASEEGVDVEPETYTFSADTQQRAIEGLYSLIACSDRPSRRKETL